MERFEEYDFIVVGAGSAGSVVASRLSENPKWNILLLEAGGDPPIESAIPMMFPTLSKTEYDWNYQIEKSDTHSIYAGGWARGKALGGSSSINGMYYVRGNEADYDHWEALGNPTWGWKDVIPYFKKSEMNFDEEIADAFGGYYHSKKGPMGVSSVNSDDPHNEDIIDAAKELGFKFLRDINANEHIGFNYAQRTIKAGVRDSTATAFLVPAKNRINLNIVKNARVLDLKFNENGEVIGVRVNIQGKQEFVAYAKKEVILSAGPINTPQILMLSGIGPAAHLQSLGIPVIKDLQVGKNLQDHPVITFFIKFDKSTAVELPPSEVLKQFIGYLTERTGYLLSATTVQTLGYMNVDNTSSLYPNIQTYNALILKGQKDLIKSSMQLYGYNEKILEFVGTLTNDANLMYITLALFDEKSRGEILLRSTDPLDKPRIFANYLAEKSDVDSFIKAIRLQLKFIETRAYKKHEAELIRVPIPECDAMEFNSDEYWACYCRYMTTTSFHPVGSAKMGPDSDSGAVVDSRLRVRGIKGLRVIDSSIMPRIISGNPNAPTIMIAEKGADFIKEDWRNVGPTRITKG
ncbi:glucose dehydrogenase [FAD, quinone]-like [Lutzomyia longipalpis]|uniref:glucose dehydrogenase [FAD, quinone]-like n=1 Tax=Lutzomyia longipalpis TaxID=7200 RepID=UPI0024840365|nr:glucose dehydrogenase [FAD, quinone]-like [Lutzomyia longipalpis]